MTKIAAASNSNFSITGDGLPQFGQSYTIGSKNTTPNTFSADVIRPQMSQLQGGQTTQQTTPSLGRKYMYGIVTDSNTPHQTPHHPHEQQPPQQHIYIDGDEQLDVNDGGNGSGNGIGNGDGPVEMFKSLYITRR